MNTVKPGLLKRLGIGYLVEALMEAVERRRREALYRVYVTDALYGLCAFAGVRLKGRYADALRPPEARDGMALSVRRLEEMGIEVVN